MVRGRHWLGKVPLNATNPFQVSGSLIGNPQFNRRERFKKVFFAVLAVHVLLFLTLLIQGCRSGQSSSSLPPNSATVTAQN
jgi:hypothetical protein